MKNEHHFTFHYGRKIFHLEALRYRSLVSPDSNIKIWLHFVSTQKSSKRQKFGNKVISTKIEFVMWGTRGTDSHYSPS